MQPALSIQSGEEYLLPNPSANDYKARSNRKCVVEHRWGKQFNFGLLAGHPIEEFTFWKNNATSGLKCLEIVQYVMVNRTVGQETWLDMTCKSGLDIDKLASNPDDHLTTEQIEQLISKYFSEFDQRYQHEMIWIAAPSR